MDLIVFDDDDDSKSDIEIGLTKPITTSFTTTATIPMKQDKLYVAVGKQVKKYESLVSWAIQNSGGRKISIIHVHQPDNFIPILGEKFHWSSLNEQQVKAYRGIERQLMLKTLDEYLLLCHEFGVQAEKLYIETDLVERGILQLISEHNIEKLVMGAAADDCYHTNMMELMSKKAVYVQRHAPAKCHIWFICKGHLIHQRKCSLPERVLTQYERPINSKSPSLMDRSTICTVRKQDMLPGEGSSHSVTCNGKFSEIPSRLNAETAHAFGPEMDLEANCYNWSEILQLLRSQGYEISAGSPSHMTRESTSDQPELFAGPFFEQDHRFPLPTAQGKLLDGVYAQAVNKSRKLEEELEKVKNDRDKLIEELQSAMDQNTLLEDKVSNYDHVMKELEESLISNVESLQVCEKERDGLKIERDNVLKTAEELLNQSAEAASSTDVPRFFNTFSIAEIKKATNDFDPSYQLWEGEDGSTYKGFLSHMQVTIKMWCPTPESLQGPREFNQEVEILSKFRHPNIVTLVGVCPEACAVVYEYLPNGSLQERLYSAGNNPLSWQTRIRIATEVCCALIFLHSRVSSRVVHGALEPASIFLDSNFTCKISNFGFSCMIPHHGSSLSGEELHSSSYTDPQYITTGVATPAVDVYSFGLILLELLTGKPSFGITDEFEEALDENCFDSLLDSSAGDWPFVQAEQLARLALRCCDENTSDRPDLKSDVWRVLEPMRTSCRGSTSNHLGDEEHRQAPSYFICPIFQEVMKDPHVAADGYTYEAEALRGWVDSGHDTSPMTNLELEHCNLVPNYALRSAIQEWRQRHH